MSSLGPRSQGMHLPGVPILRVRVLLLVLVLGVHVLLRPHSQGVHLPGVPILGIHVLLRSPFL